MRIAFIHLMKTAGTTINNAVTETLRTARYQVLNSWNNYERDWRQYELDGFVDCQDERIYVHNHGRGWPIETIQSYLENDWLTFTFYRHPGDQWCSQYFWSRGQSNSNAVSLKLPLDEFLHHAWSDTKKEPYVAPFQRLRANLDLPQNWRDLNYVAVYSPTNLSRFLKMFMNRRKRLFHRSNRSSNRGYEYYRKSGEISDATHQLLIKSQRFEEFQELNSQTHLHDHERFIAKGKSIFANRKSRHREPVRFVILFQGRAGSSWLTEHLQDHPTVHALAEIFDTIPFKSVCQKAWLSNYFVKEARRNTHVSAMGFKVKMTRILDPDHFRDFIESHGFRVIHLTRSNPVRLAISVARAEQLRANSGKSNLYDETHRLGRINISPEDFRRYLDRRQDEYTKLEEFVDTLNTPILRMSYEQMMEYPMGTLHRVFDFLGVVRFKTECRTMKNTPDDLSQAVENLDELQHAFPEYAQFFDS